MVDITLLGGIPLFEDLTEDELVSLADRRKVVKFAPDAPIFDEGEIGDQFYIVVDGQVVITKASDTGPERVLNLHGPGAFIGEMSLITPGATRSASARASTETTLMAFSRADFDEMLRQYPDLALKILAVITARLRESDNHTIQDLNEKNRQLRQAYADLQAAQEKIIERETLLRELRRARGIQESMLPQTLPTGAGYVLGATMQPAMAIGGDFYDAFVLPGGQVAIAVGDVSGKGIGAALMMTLAASLLRAEAGRAASPLEALKMVNQHLLSRPAGSMFVTVIFGLLDPTNGQFEYARAGHELPIIVDASGREQDVPSAPGQPLGIFQNPLLDSQAVTLDPGSTLALYSDGVTEALGFEYELFGTDRLLTHIMDHRNSHPQEACDELVEAIAVYSGDEPQSDDITIVTVRIPSAS